MACKIQVPESRHVFRYQSFHIDKNQPLGRGAYGAVYKAKCDQLPCAAKVLHPTILDPNDPGADNVMQRFHQECALLESIRHPNIVQYLGMTRDPESRLPVLLMELLDESLTKMLERSQRSLAYYIQVDICHDVALAVAYLHSNDIIHRDLSSNNVLMIAGRRAKVTDFGMSKLAGAAPSMTPLTMCPGTLAYMPPEALREPPRYTKKLDCFSEGVIMIQVCTRLWPEPGPRTKAAPFPASPTGMTEVPVLEPERRKKHIDMISNDHGLLPIAMECLSYQESERPSGEELCQRFAELKSSSKYGESVDKTRRRESRIECEGADSQLEQLHTELQSRGRLLESQIQQKNAKIEQLFDEIAAKDEQIKKLHHQLHQIQAHRRTDQPFQVKQNLRMHQTKSATVPVPNSQRFHAATKQEFHKASSLLQTSSSTEQQVTLGKWKSHLLGAPFRTVKADSVVIGGVAYFMYIDGTVCSYNSRSKDWRKLPSCPLQCSSLVGIDDCLTSVGGSKTPFGAPENNLYRLTAANSDKSPSGRSDSHPCQQSDIVLRL